MMNKQQGPKPARARAITLALIILLSLIALTELLVGSVTITPHQIIQAALHPQDNPLHYTIIYQFRLPRIATASLAGIALSAAGLVMQTLFRNDLAGPYVLGVSSGASLGAAIAILTANALFTTAAAPLPVAISAWIGAAITQALLILAATRYNSSYTLLILGILIAAATSAIVTILQYAADAHALKAFVIWGMGSVSHITPHQLLILAAAVATGLALTLAARRPLDLLLIGEEHAAALGLAMPKVRIVLFTATTLLAGTVTAFCGPIGFVGIAAPHLARLLYRTTRHNTLIPASALIGAATMMAADWISQMPFLIKSTLPLNAVTALMALPLIFYILLRPSDAQTR